MSLLDQRAAEAVDAILVGIRSHGAQLRALIAEADERLAAVENERGRRSLHGLEVAPAPRAHAASVRWHAGAHMSAAPIIPADGRRSLVLQLAAWPWENGEGAP